MTAHSEATAPMGSIIGDRGNGTSKSVTLQNYRTHPDFSTLDLAALKVATRFCVSLPLARTACILAGLGGAHG